MEPDFRSQQDFLRAEIRRELKIKEGAETLQKCSKDKKTKTHVNNILKQTNSRLKELHEKLDWLNKQVQDYPGKQWPYYVLCFTWGMSGVNNWKNGHEEKWTCSLQSVHTIHSKLLCGYILLLVVDSQAVWKHMCNTAQLTNKEGYFWNSPISSLRRHLVHFTVDPAMVATFSR